MRLLAALTILFLSPAVAADKKIAPVRATNDALEVLGSVASGKDAAAKLLGIDPGMELIVVELKVVPAIDGKVKLAREDFTLISRRDGQRSAAMHPSQIAGSSTLVVSSRGPGAQGGMVNQGARGPIWGGMPGTGGRPRRIGGDGEANVPVDPGETKATVTGGNSDESPLLQTLKAKELPLGEHTDGASGFLYYIFEGKHKPKDLELMYKGAGGSLILDFEK